MPKVIGIEYGGKSYTINETEVFTVCDAIEDVITLGELAAMIHDPRKIRYAKLAAAYAALLREVGAPVDPRAVHNDFRKALSGNGLDGVEQARAVMDGLISILMDGSEPSEGAPKGDKEPGNGQEP